MTDRPRPASGVAVVRVAAATVLVVVAVVVAVRLLGVDVGFPLVALLSVLPWLLGLGLLATATTALAGAPRLTVAGVVVLLAGTGALVPRVLPGPTPVEPLDGPELVVAVANLSVGRASEERILAALRRFDVDVLVTLELTDDAVGRLRAVGVDDLLPHTALRTSGRTSGAGVHSAVPLRLLDPLTPRRGANPVVELDVPGAGPLRLVTVHPLPPIDARWTRDWRDVLRLLPGPPAAGEPLAVLAGDLNATLDHAPVRDLLDAGWVDAADARGVGLRPTFSGLGAGEPVPPVTLDHVLVDPRIEVTGVAVASLPGSDHSMLVSRLRLPAR